MRTSEVEVIRQELIKAEKSGFSSRSPEDVVNAVIARKKPMAKYRLSSAAD